MLGLASVREWASTRHHDSLSFVTDLYCCCVGVIVVMDEPTQEMVFLPWLGDLVLILVFSYLLCLLQHIEAHKCAELYTYAGGSN